MLTLPPNQRTLTTMKESKTKLMKQLLRKGLRLAKKSRFKSGTINPLFTHRTKNGKFYQIDGYKDYCPKDIARKSVDVYRFDNGKDMSARPADAYITGVVQ